MDITKIVLTGAPCSGKTTIMNKLKNHYEAFGYYVAVMPECARQVIQNGVSRRDMYAFETEVIRCQLEFENRVDEEISNCKADKVIAIYDRGIADAFSYVTENQAEEIKKQLNLDLISVWSRYDAVIMLEAANPEYYTKDNERLESYEDVLEAQSRLLDVWVGHPHLRYIKSCYIFEQKLENVIREIDCVLSNIEHEVKYLIEYPNFDELKKYRPFKTDIEQIYLLSDTGSHRIRKRGSGESYCFFENLKLRISGDKCHEFESIISKERYEQLKKLANPKKHPIVKNRYCFLYDGQYFELDVFPFWQDRALIELELSYENQKVNLPPEIVVIKDVSKSKKYKNNYLASVNFDENN